MQALPLQPVIVLPQIPPELPVPACPLQTEGHSDGILALGLRELCHHLRVMTTQAPAHSTLASTTWRHPSKTRTASSRPLAGSASRCLSARPCSKMPNSTLACSTTTGAS